jgi:ribonuclease P protein component
VRPSGAPTRAGLIVAKTVGNAVARNRVKRRLRHLLRPRLADFEADVVLRALPPAAAEPGPLVADFASAWAWARRVAGAAPAHGDGRAP